MRINFTYYKTEGDLFYRERGTARRGEVVAIKTTKSGNLLVMVQEDGAEPKNFRADLMDSVVTLKGKNESAGVYCAEDVRTVAERLDGLEARVEYLEDGK